MQKLKSFFLSRKTVITILLLILATTLAGGLVPQRISTTPSELAKWTSAHPHLTQWTDRFGLFHVFSTPWFALLLLIACISLFLSTVEQFKTAHRKTYSRLETVTRDTLTIDVSEAFLCKTLGRIGYRRLRGNGGLRLVRHPWGYWSNALLHTGMLVIIAASLSVSLTQQRGVLTLVEGDIHTPQDPWIDQELGKFASPLILPESVRLDRLRIYATDRKAGKQAFSDISFIAGEAVVKRTVAVNSILHYRGLRIYQSTDYGCAFTLEITEPSGFIRMERLLIPYPSAPDEAGYNEFKLPWLPYLLSTKFYADAEMKTMTDTNPLLFLRMLDGSREQARISLKGGESGTLGTLKVRLVKVEKWTNLIVVNIAGMQIIFFGFLVVVLGTVMSYMLIPREFIARKTDEGYSVTWRATRFAEFYADEIGEILEKLRAEEGA